MRKLHGLIRCAARIFLLAVFVADSLGGAEALELVSKVPGDRRAVEIIRTEFSKDRSEATVTFASATGIFAFNLELGAARLSKLTLIVQEQSFCEGLTFRGKKREKGGETDLRTAEGVKIKKVGGNIVIELTTVAIEALRPGGQVQFVNQYR